MAAGRVIHFGEDECYRTPILCGAGYEVAQCTSIAELQLELKSPNQADLICISESYQQPREDALATARALTRAPVVLFRSTKHRYIADEFDLEIEAFAPPEIWLVRIDTLIARSRIAADQAQKLREESAAVRSHSTQLRARRKPQSESQSGSPPRTDQQTG